MGITRFIVETLGRSPTLNATMRDFNQELRFRFILNNLRKATADMPSKETPLCILDVGAGIGTLGNYLKKEIPCEIINVEVSGAHLSNLLAAEGCHLPFKDDAFDFTVSSDVLEHIREQDRSLFLAELLRCCRYGACLTFSTLQTNNPQRLGIKLFEEFSKPFPQWYIEHNSNQLVDDKKTLRSLRESNAQFLCLIPVVGVVGVLFTGILLKVRHLQAFVNLFVYPFVRLFDRVPYYGFGITALKNKEER